MRLRVHPAMLPEGEPLAKVDGVLNAVEVEGDLLGRTLFEGQGAGAMPTTSAVVADLLDAAHSVVSGGRERLIWRGEAALRIVSMDDLRTRYYLRMTVTDRPGRVAEVGGAGGGRESSSGTVRQKATEGRVGGLVIRAHEAQEAARQRALAELRPLPEIAEIGTFLRVEG